jgi:hypothetical protein
VRRFEILHGGGSSNFTDFDPGPILDEAVARIVLGWVSQPNGWLTPSGDVLPDLPCFATDVGSAWIVVERLLPVLSEPDSQDGSFFLLHSQDGSALECSKPLRRDPSYEGALWSAHFHTGELAVHVPGCPDLWGTDATCCAVGLSPAHAICLASLKGWMRFLEEKRLRYLLRPTAEDLWRGTDEETGRFRSCGDMPGSRRAAWRFRAGSHQK